MISRKPISSSKVNKKTVLTSTTTTTKPKKIKKLRKKTIGKTK